MQSIPFEIATHRLRLRLVQWGLEFRENQCGLEFHSLRLRCYLVMLAGQMLHLTNFAFHLGCYHHYNPAWKTSGRSAHRAMHESVTGCYRFLPLCCL